MKLKFDRVVVYTLFMLILAFMFVLPWKSERMTRAQTNCTTVPDGSGSSDADCSSKCSAAGHSGGFRSDAGTCMCNICGNETGADAWSGCSQAGNSVLSAFSCGGG